MAITLDGTSGVTTPGVVNTAGETIATTLSVTGATNLAVSSGNVGIGTASPGALLHVGTTTAKIRIGATAGSEYLDISRDSATGNMIYNAAQASYGAHNFQIAGTEQARIDPAGLFKFNSGYGSAATAYGCRAWVNFNGTGTPAIRASGNVSSITDNGTGDFTINFTTAMVDANYCTVGTCVFDFNNQGQIISNANTGGQTTSGVRIGVRFAATSAFNDTTGNAVSIFR